MRTLTIFKAVTRNWMRSRSGLFFSILFPVLLLLVFGAVFSGIGGSSRSTLFVQNLDISASTGEPSSFSEDFIDALNSTETFNIREVPTDANASTYTRNALGPLGGNIRILVISEGFQEDLLNGTFKVRVGITYGTLNISYQYLAPNMSDTQKIAFQQGLVQLQQFNQSLPDTKTSLTVMVDSSDQSAAVIKNIIVSVANAFNYELIGAENVIQFEEASVTATRFSNVDYYVPGITAAFIMTNGIIALTSNTTEFKRRGIIKRLSITPLTKMDWIMGNVLSQTLLNLMLTVVMIAVGWLIFNVRVIPDALSILLIFLGSIMFAGIGMTLSGLVKDVEAASAIGNAIAFPMMFLSGTYFPLEIMPSYIQTISKALPLTYFSEGLRYAMIYKYVEGVYTNMAIVAILAVVFIAVGSLVTRWKEK
ncbi:MAG TPA: ABC transporter permease [Candidatus Bathyarchaeia archaeon]|nr:ABC transporter permease [Candidatus Bathyarchaeia archaeon]